MRRTMAAYLTAAASVLRPALVPAAALALITATPGVVRAVGPTVAVEAEAYGEFRSAPPAVVGDELVRVSDRGRPVEIEIWVNRGEGATYRDREEVGIRFRASRDCYVVIYDIDTEGFLTLLYPDDPYDDGLVRGGRVYRLPGATAGYDLLAEGPPGVEYVAAVAGLVPLAESLPWYLSESYETYGYRGHYDLDATVSDVGAVRGDPYVAMRDIAYDILPESIREREYDTDYTYFHVGRRCSHPRYLCYDCHGRVDWLDPYYDSCSVFDIRIDLGWRFVSHPTFYRVGPRFWYWRRPDCPSVYVGLPTFWCSLYPRRFYRAYYWDGLVAVGSRHGAGRTVYPPPRYRGKPEYWAKGRSDGGRSRHEYGRRVEPKGESPGRRRYGRGADTGGKDLYGRGGGGKKPGYKGGRKPDLPRGVTRPERLAELRDARSAKTKAKLSGRRTESRSKSRAKVSEGKDGRRASKSKAKISKAKSRSKGGGEKSSVKSGAGKSKSKSGGKARKSKVRSRQKSSSKRR